MPEPASGTGVSLSYVREAVKGEAPAAVTTPTTTIAAVASGTKFTRASGSFITDGFAVGQYVKTEGFADTDDNGTWLVTAVSALELTVDDPGGLIGDEAADVGQTVTILMNQLRATSRAVNLEKNTLESAEVRADRQISTVRHGFNRVAGAPGFELSRAAYDDILALALSGAWTDVTVDTPGDIGCTTSGGPKFTRATGSWITDGFRPGDIIRTASFSNSVNNGDFRVISVTATDLVVDMDGATMITEAASGTPTIIYPGQRLDVGALLQTLTVERAFSDIAQFQVFNGVAVNEFSLSIQPEAIVGGSAALLGMIAQAISGTSIADEDKLSLGNYNPFSSFDGKIHEGGSTIAIATGLDFALNNNRTLNPVIGSFFSPTVFEGRCMISGTLSAYFLTVALLNKFINETESSIYLKLDDPDSTTEWMSFVLPRVKYTGGDIDPPQEGPVVLSMPFTALVEEDLAVSGGLTTNSCLTIQRSS